MICSINQIENYTPLTNKLFPDKIDDTERKLKKEDIYFGLKLFGNAEKDIDSIKGYIKEKMDNKEKNNVLLIYPDKDKNINENIDKWKIIAGKINELAEVNLPFIIFLSFYSYDQIKNNIFKGDQDIFNNFKDRRKIMILQILPLPLNNEENENLEINYRKILSLLWEINQIYNQTPFKLSKVIDANLFRIREESETIAIKILMAGFSRKGKSTFINMTFDKMISYESPMLTPVTSEIIEIAYTEKQNNRKEVQDQIKGIIKFIDIPGIIEGTNNNIKNVEDLIKKSIEIQKESLDVINYIFFILKSQPNFEGTDSLLKLINDSGIKIIFIINDSTEGATKETMIDNFGTKFPNLIINKGENIIQINIRNDIKSVYKYIYQDLLKENKFDMDKISHMNDDDLIKYLNKNTTLYSNIGFKEDFIKRAVKKANIIRNSIISSVAIVGFSPVPFIDVPITLFLIAQMILMMFNSFGFLVNIEFINNFFIYSYGENAQRAIGEIRTEEENNQHDNNNNYDIKYYILKVLYKIVKISGIYKHVIYLLSTLFIVRMGIIGVAGVLDFIPIFGTIGQGFLNLAINTPMVKGIADSVIKYSEHLIKTNGLKNNVINQIKGYKKSFDIIKNLSERNDWQRKIQFPEEQI